MITQEEGRELLKIATKVVKDSAQHKKIKIDNKLKEKYSTPMGVFVTIKIDHELRGCIGMPYPDLPLIDALTESAVDAALNDPRFLPLVREELPKIEVEISILTKPELIEGEKEEYTKQIKIGRDGLIVEKGKYKGLLLPQVFTEWKANPEAALEMTCDKAGLRKVAWKDKDCKVFKFQAQIFSEQE